MSDKIFSSQDGYCPDRISSCWHLSFFLLLNHSLPCSLIPASVCLCYAFSLGSCVWDRRETAEAGAQLPWFPTGFLSPWGDPDLHGNPCFQYQEPFLALTHPLSGSLTLCSGVSISVSIPVSWTYFPVPLTNKQITQNLSSLVTSSQLPSEFSVPTAARGFKSVIHNCHHYFLSSFSLFNPLVFQMKQLLSRFPASHVSQPVVPSACHIT